MQVERYKVDIVVIGAGAVGLAVARELALGGREVLLLEQNRSFGMETSSRNSEVVHAGIYYPKGSLKARFCVEGKQLLYAYCESRKVEFKRCGKLIVATKPEQVLRLKEILRSASENGVDDLEWVTKERLQEIEPQVRGEAALLSPSTGVIDSHQYMLQLLTDFEGARGQFVANTQVESLGYEERSVLVKLRDGTCLVADVCINAAGLNAHKLLVNSGFPSHMLPRLFFAKGDYFSYQGTIPFKHLIYPVPEDGGLGVHLTLDLNGSARFGPDVTWLDTLSPDEIDYSIMPSKRDSFALAVKRYWPEVDVERLVPDYSGVRPKLSGPGEPAEDFVIQTPSDHGVCGLLNLFGIESPGLTASLAIAKHVESVLFVEP